MRKIIFKIALLFSFLLLIYCVEDYIVGKFLEERIAYKFSLDWRNYNSIFQDCYELSDHLGFEPIWGTCGYPILSSVSFDKDGALLGKMSNKYRILILGDSNTNRGKFDILLNNKLQETNNIDGKEFEIIKIGIESYNTFQEIELLKTRLLKLDPDIVILQFTLNDFEFSPIVLRIKDKYFYFSSKGEKSIEINSFLFKHSSIYRIYELNKIHTKEKDMLDNIVEPENYWKREVESMDKALESYKKIIDDNNILGVVVIYPIFADTQWEDEKKEIVSLLEKKGLYYIDLFDNSIPFGGPKYFQEDTDEGKLYPLHPNNNKFDPIVSDALSEYIFNVI